MDTIRQGNGAEAGVLKALVDAGLHVLLPFGGGCPFDLAVATPGGRVLRLQVKSGRVRDGCVRFNSCSTDHGRGRLHYRDRADVIAVSVGALDRVFVVPVHDCPPSPASWGSRRRATTSAGGSVSRRTTRSRPGSGR